MQTPLLFPYLLLSVSSMAAVMHRCRLLSSCTDLPFSIVAKGKRQGRHRYGQALNQRVLRVDKFRALLGFPPGLCDNRSVPVPVGTGQAPRQYIVVGHDLQGDIQTLKDFGVDIAHLPFGECLGVFGMCALSSCFTST